jgi:hypothetical protein
MIRRTLRLGALLAACALAACAASPPPLTAAGPAAPKGPCGRYVVGASAALGTSRALVLLGGQGSVEAPRFVSDLVCQLAAERPVVLAIDWPRDASPSVGALLGQSARGPDRLRAEALWTSAITVERGLATTAMWQLALALRDARAAGRQVHVVPFGFVPTESEPQYDVRWDGYQRREKLDGIARRFPDATVVLWLSEADLLAPEPRREQAQAARPGEPSASRMALVDYAGELAAKAPRFALEEGGAAPAPWAFERRADRQGAEGVFRLGPTTASPLLVQPR